MIQPTIEAELKALMARELGVSPDRICAMTSLLHDLGVDGFDAEEFIEKYAQYFTVDMAGFDVRRHFGPEAPFNPFLYLYWRLFSPAHLRVVPITFSHLLRCALDRRWTTPTEPPRAHFERQRA